MKSFAGYIRVSTAKQGEKGVSLQEQRSAIEAYAARSQIVVSDWFEELETAAKRGRPCLATWSVGLGVARFLGSSFTS